MIIDINILEGSKNFEILEKCINELKTNDKDVSFDVYKDKKAFTTDIDVEYVVDDISFDIYKEYGVELFDCEKEELIENVSYRIFNNYDYSEYNEYIADLARDCAYQYMVERKEIATDLLDPKLSLKSLIRTWGEVFEPYDIEINSDGEIVYDDGYFFKKMIEQYFMEIEPLNKDEGFPKEFIITFTIDEDLSKMYKIEAKYDEDNYCSLLLSTLEELKN